MDLADTEFPTSPMVRWWAAPAAALAPVTMLGIVVASELTTIPHYNPRTQTLSDFAVSGPTGWLITTGFFIVAMCQIITAFGLPSLPILSRTVLSGAGCCGLILALALLQQHTSLATDIHLMATGAAAILLALWPLSTIAVDAPAPSWLRLQLVVPVSASLLVLLVWVFYEAIAGHDLGLAERICVESELVWPVVVASAATRSARRRPQPPDQAQRFV